MGRYFFRAMSMAAFGCLALSATANAQAVRTWVSGVGDDANPCSRTAPCKTFAGAISKTAAGGEIDALDPGGFGAVTITKSISLSGAGTLASILASGTNALNINAPGAMVSIRGLDILGGGTGLNGINIVSAAKVHIEDCFIHGFTQAGIAVASTAATRVDVRHSSIYFNNIGIKIDGTSAAAGLFLEDSVLDSNVAGNAVVDGAMGALTLSNDTVIAATPGITTTNGATLRSFGNNRLNNATPTATSPLQ